MAGELRNRFEQALDMIREYGLFLAERLADLFEKTHDIREYCHQSLNEKALSWFGEGFAAEPAVGHYRWTDFTREQWFVVSMTIDELERRLDRCLEECDE